MTLEEAAHALSEAGVENPRAEARLLLAVALGLHRDQTLALTGAPTPDDASRFAALVARRAAREPFAYIVGHKEFWSLNFAVGPGVLVPRPDSETLIEQAARLSPDHNAPLRIADLGVGSGALLIAALSLFPQARGVGFESSPEAFAWAQRNAAALVPGRTDIRLADWNSAEGPFDLVFSNPPYIPSAQIAGLTPEVAGHEPHAALDGGADGLDAYRALAGLLPRLLRPGGHALLEMGLGQAPSLERLFTGSAWKQVHAVPDLAGIPRALVLQKA